MPDTTLEKASAPSPSTNSLKLSSTKIEIRLDGSNYVFWEYAMVDMLRDHGLLQYVQYVRSKEELEKEGLSPKTTDAVPEHARKMAKAASAISKNLGQEQIALILTY